MNHAIGWVLQVGAGIVGGVFATLLITQLHEEPDATATPPAKSEVSTERTPAAGATESANASRIAALEATLARQTAASPAPGGEHIKTETTERLTKEEQSAKELATYRTLLAQHEQEPVDASWARTTQSAINDELAAIAQRSHYEVESVNCRTSSCVAKLRWPNRSDAKEDLTAVVSGATAGNCVRTMAVTGPETPGEYRASLYFDCATARASSNL